MTPTWLTADVVLLTTQGHADMRGAVAETFRDEWLKQIGVDTPIRQENFSYSAKAGTVRGLHCQIAPKAQGKLVRVLRGEIVDVVVDIRHGSPSFGKLVVMPLKAGEPYQQLWVPVGFLHGFVTLVDDTEVLYKMTDVYSPEHERGVAWDDPDLGIPWPIPQTGPIVSERDKRHPRLRDAPAWFTFG